MNPGLPDLPILKSQTVWLEASQYNRVRLALKRLGAPQEVVLGNRGLTVQLGSKAWLCADRRLNDVPLVAWTGFGGARRTGLHEPVEARSLYYHAYAWVIAGAVLAEVDWRLADRLRAPAGHAKTALLRLPLRRTDA